MAFTAEWMDLENTMLSEQSQAQMVTNYDSIYMKYSE